MRLLTKIQMCLFLCFLLLAVSTFGQNQPQITAGPSITSAQWQADIRFLAGQMPKQHPNLFRRMKKEDFDAEVNKLYDAVPTMNEDEIMASLMKLVAMVNDGHTNVFPPGLLEKPVFPVHFYIFEDGLYIRNAAPNYANIVGAKVIQIGDVSADEAVKRMSPLAAADNDMGRRQNAPFLLSIPQLAAALKITPDKEHLRLTVATGDISKTVDVIPAFNLNDIIHPPADWPDAAKTSGGKLPLYLRDSSNPYWFDYDKDRKLLYVQQNQVLNKDGGETIEQFYKRVMAVVDQNPVDKFILDLRNNGGGNNQLNRPVVIDLIKSKINERGHLFVVIGRGTFSAAQNFVNELEKYTEAIFIGEPTADHTNLYGDNRPIILPNSKLTVRVSTLYWQDMDPRDNRQWTAPEIAAAPTSAEYKSGVDPALSAILEYSPASSFQSIIAAAATNADISDFIRKYDAFRADPKHKFVETEAAINRLGYTLLQNKRTTDAIEVFKLNARDVPTSANVFDSLGDGYAAAGNRSEAIKSYEKALTVDPNYASSAESLRKLKGN